MTGEDLVFDWLRGFVAAVVTYVVFISYLSASGWWREYEERVGGEDANFRVLLLVVAAVLWPVALVVVAGYLPGRIARRRREERARMREETARLLASVDEELRPGRKV